VPSLNVAASIQFHYQNGVDLHCFMDPRPPGAEGKIERLARACLTRGPGVGMVRGLQAGVVGRCCWLVLLAGVVGGPLAFPASGVHALTQPAEITALTHSACRDECLACRSGMTGAAVTSVTVRAEPPPSR
jgi:hypothetical protein